MQVRRFSADLKTKIPGGVAGDHKDLVKIPRIFLALPNPTALAPTDGRRRFH